MGFLFVSYFILCFVTYFLPTLTALFFGSNRAGEVFLINFLLGWTIIGWIWAFVWAVTPKKLQQNLIINNNISADRTINPIITQPNNDNNQ